MDRSIYPNICLPLPLLPQDAKMSKCNLLQAACSDCIHTPVVSTRPLVHDYTQTRKDTHTKHTRSQAKKSMLHHLHKPY